MKLRYGFLFLAVGALLAAGCGSDDDNGDGGKDAKMTKAEKAVAEDRDNKEKAVKAALVAFKKDKKDVGNCRNLSMSYIALASPASSPDPKTPPALPKDRDKNLKKAVVTLEKCVKIDKKDRDVKQMLASSYMATNAYDKASPLLEQLAKSAKGAERANAFYAWGLAASNAQEYDKAISAWRQFIALAPAKDPRIAQVKQSIKALIAAQKQPTPAAGGESTDESKESKDSGN